MGNVAPPPLSRPLDHPSLDATFHRNFVLTEPVRRLRAGGVVWGAQCRMRRSGSRPFFVLIEDERESSVTASAQFSSKLGFYHAFGHALPSGVAALPPSDVPWSNWPGWRFNPMGSSVPCPKLWMVTEFMQHTLTTLPVPSQNALGVYAGVMHAARSLHDVGFVHGDIAPDNIGVRDDNSLALIDLGVTQRIRILQPEEAEGYEVSRGHTSFMSVAQHGSSIPHSADDIESAAYVALWTHNGRTMDTADEKLRWMAADNGDDVERELRLVARRAAAASRHQPPPADLYDSPALPPPISCSTPPHPLLPLAVRDDRRQETCC